MTCTVGNPSDLTLAPGYKLLHRFCFCIYTTSQGFQSLPEHSFTNEKVNGSRGHIGMPIGPERDPQPKNPITY